jgi:hypothetical protein
MERFTDSHGSNLRPRNQFGHRCVRMSYLTLSTSRGVVRITCTEKSDWFPRITRDQ